MKMISLIIWFSLLISPLFAWDVFDNLKIANNNVGINVETLSGDKILNPKIDKMYQYLDPGNDLRRVTLATATAKAGDRFVIRHNGAFDNIYTLDVFQGDNNLDEISAGNIKEFIFDGINWVSAVNGTGEDSLRDHNTALGRNARASNEGTAFGYLASGEDHGVAVGLATGSTYGVSIGYGVVSYNYGVAIGSQTYGFDNGVAIGYSALGSNGGLAIGYNATGYAHGVAIGYNAKGNFYGVAIGYQAGMSDFNPTYNIYIGYQAGSGITTGINNIIIGRQDSTTGRITTGDNNILIGYEVGAGISSTESNQLNIGNLIFGTGLSTGSTFSDGNVGIGTASPNSKLEIQTGSATKTGLIIKGDGLQTANLQEWQDNSGLVLLQIDANGGLVLGTSAKIAYDGIDLIIDSAIAGSGLVKFNNSNNWAVGSGTALLGANCPAINCSSPYQWLKVKTSDGNIVYIPAYR